MVIFRCHIVKLLLFPNGNYGVYFDVLFFCRKQEVAFSNGIATFSDLNINVTGSYSVNFTVSKPARISTWFGILSVPVTIVQRPLAVKFLKISQHVQIGEKFDVEAQLKDADTGNVINDAFWLVSFSFSYGTKGVFYRIFNQIFPKHKLASTSIYQNKTTILFATSDHKLVCFL